MAGTLTYFNNVGGLATCPIRLVQLKAPSVQVKTLQSVGVGIALSPSRLRSRQKKNMVLMRQSTAIEELTAKKTQEL